MTFGAMSNAEWEKIAQQVGTVGNTLGGIYYIQGRLRATAEAEVAKAKWINDWLNDERNVTKNILNMQTEWYESDAFRAARDKWFTQLNGYKAEADNINAKQEGFSDSTDERIDKELKERGLDGLGDNDKGFIDSFLDEFLN